jgi:hypothetical protein
MVMVSASLGGLVYRYAERDGLSPTPLSSFATLRMTG